MTTFEARSIRAPVGDTAPYLGRLSLRNYRNFEALECEFPAPGVVIIGPNGAGKTNLLEAIYYLEVFRSFRGAKDAQLVRFGEDVFRIEGELSAGAGSVAAAYDRQRRVKKVEVDDREVDRVSEGVGVLGVSVFRLEDAEIVRGGPGERRRFLDVALSLTSPGYLAALQRYRTLLAQRNEALRRGAADDEIAAWSGGLVDVGARVTAARSRWIAEGSERFGQYYAWISDGDEAALGYLPSIGVEGEAHGGEGLPSEIWEERFRVALDRTAERERRQGVTLVGPHRDELSFRVRAEEGWRSLRRFGSSGQQRTGALALRLLESDRLSERLDRDPVYLLDDVFAELDEGRSARLLDLFESGRPGQVILTAPKPGDVGLRGGDLAQWRMREGRMLA